MSVLSLFDEFSDVFHRNAYSYCQILSKSTFDSDTLIGKDGQCISIFEISGNFKYLTDETELYFIEDLHDQIDSQCRQAHYELDFHFVRDKERTLPELNRSFSPAENSIQRMGLKSGNVLRNQKLDLAENCAFEKFLFIITTRPSLVPNAEKIAPPRICKEKLSSSDIPVANQAIYSESKAIVDSHTSFRETIKSSFSNYIDLTLLDQNEALRSILEEIEHANLSEVDFIDHNNDFDLAYSPTELTYFSQPPLAYQLMREPLLQTKDSSIYEREGRFYAPLQRDWFPINPTTFSKLFNTLNISTPFRFNYSMKLGTSELKSALNSKKSLLNFFFFSPSINENRDAVDNLIDLVNNHNVTLAAGTLSLCTWASTLEKAQSNKKDLKQALMAWGNTISSAPLDKARGFVSTIPAYTEKKVGRPCIQPLYKHMLNLPITRPCQPMKTGGMCLSSLDGRPFPIHNRPSNQNYILNLIVGGMGGGKTVFASILNDSFVWGEGNEVIPLIGYLDWGSGVENYIKSLKGWLPENRQHEAICITMKIKAGYAINFFEPSFGFTRLVEEEHRFALSFITRMVNGTRKEPVHSQVGDVISEAIRLMFEELTDNPIPYANRALRYAGIEEQLHGDISRLLSNGDISFEAHEKASWWNVRDKLYSLDKDKYFAHARFAHRQGAPTLRYFLENITRNQSLAEKYDEFLVDGKPIMKYLKASIGGILERYDDVFGFPSQIDVSQARVIGVNLQNVVGSGTDSETVNTSKLFSMLGKYLITKNFWREPEDFLPQVPPLYRELYEYIIKRDMSGDKHQLIDEFKKCTSDEMEALVEGDVLVGRKYRLATSLAMQMIKHSPSGIRALASNIYVLDMTDEDAKILKDTFDMSPNFIFKAKNLLAKPYNGFGRVMLFIGKYTNMNGTVIQLLRNYITPSYLWHFSNDQIDVDIKELVEKRFGDERGYELLAKRFPSGTIKHHMEKVMASATSRNIVTSENEVKVQIVKELEQDYLNLVNN